jgi:hypothetical protein
LPIPFTTSLSELNRLYGEYYDATYRSKDEAETAWIVYVQYLKRYMQERGMAVVDENPPKS